MTKDNINVAGVQVDRIITFEEAFFELQKEIPHIKKGSVNTYHNNSPYANLPDIREILLPILQKHYFSITQSPSLNIKTKFAIKPRSPDQEGDQISHGDNEESYEWKLITEIYHLPSKTYKYYHHPFNCKDMGNPQTFGSSETYACRYALTHIFFLVLDDPSDDDGNKGASVDNMSSGDKKSSNDNKSTPPRGAPPGKPKTGGIGPSEKQIAAVFKMANFKKISENDVRATVQKRFNVPLESLDKESFQKVFEHYKNS